MSAGIFNISLEQGTTFSLPLEVSQSNGTPMNLTGYTKRGQIRPFATSNVKYADFTISGSVDVSGSFHANLSAVETARIPAGLSYYDIEIESSDGEVTKLLRGTITTIAEVTR